MTPRDSRPPAPAGRVRAYASNVTCGVDGTLCSHPDHRHRHGRERLARRPRPDVRQRRACRHRLRVGRVRVRPHPAARRASSSWSAGTRPRRSRAPIHILLARYETNGTLDPAFGAGGKVTTDLGGSDAAFAGILQPDGKIVVVGGSSNDSALVRDLPDGGLDPAFGVGGSGSRPTWAGLRLDEALAVDLQPDGKIVVGGRAGSDMVLARFDPAGALAPDVRSSGHRHDRFHRSWVRQRRRAMERGRRAARREHRGGREDRSFPDSGRRYRPRQVPPRPEPSTRRSQPEVV